jgi:hypothetical protein
VLRNAENPQLGPKYWQMRDNLWGADEEHGLGGDCANPYCDYEMGDQDWQDIGYGEGQWQCPNCGFDQIIPTGDPSGGPTSTRSGMDTKTMGQLGEEVARQAIRDGALPQLGPLRWQSPDYNDPIDMVVGGNALEVKTLHSESFPRFKMGPSRSSRSRANTIKAKVERTRELSAALGTPLSEGTLGVRLNFYTGRADFFYATEFRDRMMTAMTHLGEYDFSKLNPFRDHVPGDLPQQGATEPDEDDIPF